MVRRLVSLSVPALILAIAPSALAEPPPASAPAAEPATQAAEVPASGTLLVEVDDPEASLLLDGSPFGNEHLSKPAPVAAGHHVVEARLRGRAPQRREVEVRPGEIIGVVLRFLPARTDAIGYDVEGSGGEQAAHDGTPRLPLILAGAGVSVAALAVGIAFNLVGNGRASDAAAEQRVIGLGGGTTSSCSTPGGAFASACGALHYALVARDRDATVAVVSYATAGAAAAATIAYAIWSIPSERHHPVWTSSLRPAPVVGGDAYGVAIAGVF